MRGACVLGTKGRECRGNGCIIRCGAVFGEEALLGLLGRVLAYGVVPSSV